MRQYVYLVLIALVLVVPFAMRRGVRARSGDAVVRRGAARLVIVTPHNQDICREYQRRFVGWYRDKYGADVDIDYRVVGGTNDVKRLLTTTFDAYRDASGNLRPDASAGIDLAWGGGDYFFERELKPLGILRPIKLDPALIRAAFPDPLLAGVKLYDWSKDAGGREQPIRWVGVCLSAFGIIYNPGLYRSAALDLPPPRQWADLTSPKLAGYIALADPTHSGSAAVAYLMVIQRAMADAENDIFASRPDLKRMPKAQRDRDADYRAGLDAGFKKGMGQLLLIAANARYFSDSATQPPNDVSNGEAAAGTAIDFYGRVYEETVGRDRIRVVLPQAATAITPDPIAVLQGANEELANRFIEFLLTPEAQRLWDLKPGTPGGPQRVSLRRLPVRRDVYADRTGWSDDLNPFEQAGGFNQRNEWMTFFSDLQWIWAAAWIDSRDALVDAYAKVRAVADPSKRQSLIEELADLPVSLDRSALPLRIAGLQSISPSGADAGVDRARQRIDWAKRFREHYHKVGTEAQR
jgi:iron(III) transport system substrate-binding protein